MAEIAGATRDRDAAASADADPAREKHKRRRDVLSVLVRARAEELDGALRALDLAPEFEVLRAPEFGLAMTRGRIGGGGAPFNLGEVTVTRTVVRLASGEVGYGHILGRDRKRAHLVALFDALWQSEATRAVVEDRLLASVAARTAEEDRHVRVKTAATRVNFFTMVRGED
ncbi:phosphonate C-P lyase system protein PhnG [Afifella marina]|uniref:Alpha-D-ribose 1-methylphosphonate 5-triphosphate synthase subunit PhnG n=1 Tax=Afifella marina DSM 2698 TaxID=1120955 RepID=A0A1G5MUY7_AFIMA|nr:phosphonate C-P lyase system protein PhnG [Afifella marina]MBK1621983.1 phosphonate C-P lyase system protein PhnG [Afifella marina DSM 2698]MBK1627776.1 phosphonate C-P lyase system protein PhnG [Afifella marina]MBK5916743.1 phosphonate C-P lyase system protein PhnG [Afifella marina]RAI19930.1 phosphonate C-P lyase system protein PhnG [Afifella marina DSM 2698]SCZ28644.1 alpha-D-ribose 1-methylphosphonate 5-triphosphate synthase subunit PhnG [Afifella marina DSM 2698]